MTSFFEHQKLSFKKSYFRNLILLASADGHLDETEKETLLVIGKKRGLKEWQIEELFNDHTPFEIFIPESFNNRMNLLYDLMQVIYADGKVDESEISFVENTLASFHLSKDIAIELIRLFKSGVPSATDWRNFTDAIQDSSSWSYAA
ncbi:MAG: TerB family tellurite resistance protein [Bacteroidota bacterium]